MGIKTADVKSTFFDSDLAERINKYKLNYNETKKQLEQDFKVNDLVNLEPNIEYNLDEIIIPSAKLLEI